MSEPIKPQYIYDSGSDTVTFTPAVEFSGTLSEVAEEIHALDTDESDDTGDGRGNAIPRFSTANFKEFLSENGIVWNVKVYKKYENVYERGYINHTRAAKYIREVSQQKLSLADFLIQQDNAAPERNNFWSRKDGYVRIFNKDTFADVMKSLGQEELDEDIYNEVQKGALNKDKIINLRRAAMYIREALG